MKKTRPAIITAFCWFFVVVGALSIVTSLLPYVSVRMDTLLGTTLHQSRGVVLVYSLVRNCAVILAAIGLLKGFPWSRVLFVAYFLMVTLFNYILYHHFSWVSSIMVVLYIVFLYLPLTTDYLRGTFGTDLPAPDSGDSSEDKQ